MGGRSVKWITGIRLSDAPSDAPWNAHYYHRADGSHVQQLPLQSFILQPAERERVAANADGTLSLGGVAYNGANSGVDAVEVSADGGASWHAATLLRDEVLPDDARSPHNWLRWVAHVPLPRQLSASTANMPDGEAEAGARCSVCCRAFDANGQSQPRVSQKQRGYLYNGWFKVNLAVAPAAAAGGASPQERARAA